MFKSWEHITGNQAKYTKWSPSGCKRGAGCSSQNINYGLLLVNVERSRLSDWCEPPSNTGGQQHPGRRTPKIPDGAGDWSIGSCQIPPEQIDTAAYGFHSQCAVVVDKNTHDRPQDAGCDPLSVSDSHPKGSDLCLEIQRDTLLWEWLGLSANYSKGLWDSISLIPKNVE
jgi:hypothetical protein